MTSRRPLVQWEGESGLSSADEMNSLIPQASALLKSPLTHGLSSGLWLSCEGSLCARVRLSLSLRQRSWRLHSHRWCHGSVICPLERIHLGTGSTRTPSWI
jgi:hypothetical protein